MSTDVTSGTVVKDLWVSNLSTGHSRAGGKPAKDKVVSNIAIGDTRADGKPDRDAWYTHLGFSGILVGPAVLGK